MRTVGRVHYKHRQQSICCLQRHLPATMTVEAASVINSQWDYWLLMTALNIRLCVLHDG